MPWSLSIIVVGTYFARFWRETGDRLFWCLAAAFWLFAVNYAAIGALPLEDERGAYAFAAILVGVLLKDRELVDAHVSFAPGSSRLIAMGDRGDRLTRVGAAARRRR